MENNKENRVYGLILEIQTTLFLSVQYASCLEEAFALAKLDFERMNPVKNIINVGNQFQTAKIGLFMSKTFDQLVDEHTAFINHKDLKTKPTAIKEFLPTPEEVMGKINKLEEDDKKQQLEKDPVFLKNILMKEIIEKKDKKELKKNKDKLTIAEYRYIKQLINK